MKSIRAVVLGIFVALAVGVLIVLGLMAPIFTVLFGMEFTGTPLLPLILIVIAAAFAFYWGGMAAGYKAPGRRGLHGALVAPAAFAISPLFNLIAGKPPVPAFAESGTAAALSLVALLVSIATSYIGGRRGETLHAFNQAVLRREQRKKEAREAERSNGSAKDYGQSEGDRSANADQ